MTSSIRVCTIVGNGFDLAAGLGTSSVAFVKSFESAHRGEETPAGRLAAKMVEQGIDEWSDFEAALGKYAADLGAVLTGEELEFEYLEAKEAVEDDLITFVAKQEQAIEDDYIDARSEVCITSICNWFVSLAPREREKVMATLGFPFDVIFSFVTLNYTFVLDQMVDLVWSNSYRTSQATGISSFILEKPIHVHGKIDENPICGVNDPSQIANDALRSSAAVQDTVVKERTQALFGNMDGDFALEDISHANIVLIFGCSIGLTDKRWWEAVVDWMKGSSARFVVIASYRLEQHRKTARSFRDFTLGLKERLFKSADRADDEEKESLFDRIFIISSSSIFNFKDTTG